MGLLDFGIRVTPRTDFGRFRTSRIGFGVICPYDAVCSSFRVAVEFETFMSRVILLIRFTRTRRSDSPPNPPRIHPKSCSDPEMHLSWPKMFHIETCLYARPVFHILIFSFRRSHKPLWWEIKTCGVLKRTGCAARELFGNRRVNSKKGTQSKGAHLVRGLTYI